MSNNTKSVFYSYRFRLYPNKDQKVFIDKHFGCCRFIYNYFLDRRVTLYKETKKSSSYKKDSKLLPDLKKEFPWLAEVSSQSLQQSLKNLQKSYEHFFIRVKSNQGNPGHPKFKKKSNKQSFRIPQKIKIVDGKLSIEKFREGIPVLLHRDIVGKIKSAVVSKNCAGQYFVRILVEKDVEELSKNNNRIGIDLNVQSIVLSDSSDYQNPRPEYKNRDKFKLLTKKISRTKPGSRGRDRARLKLAKLTQYFHDVRSDFHHKLSKQIIDKNQVIVVEDLIIQTMIAKTNSNHRKMIRLQEKASHRNISDCSFYSFVEKLAYKAEWYGRTFIKVDRWFPSSQLCSECGWRYENLPKNCKEWSCPECNTKHDRDHNAAKNIINEGLRILAI